VATGEREVTEWRDVPSAPGYESSADGRIRHACGDELGQWSNDQGYKMVRLKNPRRMARAHRLIADAWVPNPDNKPAINHINNDRADNRAENLEWCTQAENLAYARKQRRSPNARLTDDQVAAIRNEYSQVGTSWESLGKRYGMSKRAIGRIVRRETYV
jgi:hypothetical protein